MPSHFLHRSRAYKPSDPRSWQERLEKYHAGWQEVIDEVTAAYLSWKYPTDPAKPNPENGPDPTPKPNPENGPDPTSGVQAAPVSIGPEV